MVLSAFLFSLASANDCPRLDPSKLVIDVLGARCSRSFLRDSYGRGLEAGVLGPPGAERPANDRRPRVIDEECYELGRLKGEQIAASAGRGYCLSKFAPARRAGLRADTAFGDTGTPCGHAGYEAGIAALGVGARECDATEAGAGCVDAYWRGVRSEQGSERREPTQAAQYCYDLGVYEAPLYIHNR